MKKYINKKVELLSLSEVKKNSSLSEKFYNKYMNILDEMFTDSVDCNIENTVEELEDVGFKNCEIRYSGFYNQGDGASFTCTSIDIFKIKKYCIKIANSFNDTELELINSIYEFFINRHTFRYNHENTVKIDFISKEGYDLKSKKFNLFLELLNNFRVEMCQNIYGSLKIEYEYYNKIDRIIHYINNNYWYNTEEPLFYCDTLELYEGSSEKIEVMQ